MKNRTLISICFSTILFLNSGLAHAINLDFIPPSQTVVTGTPIDVGIAISRLGAGSAPSLGTFDVVVNFDPTILGFNSVAYGDPGLGDQLDLFGFGSFIVTTPGLGFVNLFELSFDFPIDLDTLQAGSFTLATLTFDTLMPGTSPLGLNVNALGDSFGDTLSAEVGSGSVDVVPEPATIFLFGSGVIGLVAWRVKAATRQC